MAVAAYISSQWLTVGHSQSPSEERLPLPEPLPGVGQPPNEVNGSTAQEEKAADQVSVPDPALNSIPKSNPAQGQKSFEPQKVEKPAEKKKSEPVLAETPKESRPTPNQNQIQDVSADLALPGNEPMSDLNTEPVLENSVSKNVKTTILEPYIYDSERRRDPFEPYVNVQPLESGTFQGPLLPLQRYDLDQLNLIGVLWDVKEPKAMFLDPNKKIHILGKDERIGRNSGYIAVIREGEVVVVESVMVRGELSYTTRTLKMVR